MDADTCTVSGNCDHSYHNNHNSSGSSSSNNNNNTPLPLISRDYVICQDLRYAAPYDTTTCPTFIKDTKYVGVPLTVNHVLGQMYRKLKGTQPVQESIQFWTTEIQQGRVDIRTAKQSRDQPWTWQSPFTNPYWIVTKITSIRIRQHVHEKIPSPISTSMDVLGSFPMQQADQRTESKVSLLPQIVMLKARKRSRRLSVWQSMKGQSLYLLSWLLLLVTCSTCQSFTPFTLDGKIWSSLLSAANDKSQPENNILGSTVSNPIVEKNGETSKAAPSPPRTPSPIVENSQRQPVRRRKMELMWCGIDNCKDAIRERVVDDHVLLNGPATGQGTKTILFVFAYEWKLYDFML
jgi:hypothetical protein